MFEFFDKDKVLKIKWDHGNVLDLSLKRILVINFDLYSEFSKYIKYIELIKISSFTPGLASLNNHLKIDVKNLVDFLKKNPHIKNVELEKEFSKLFLNLLQKHEKYCKEFKLDVDKILINYHIKKDYNEIKNKKTEAINEMLNMLEKVIKSNLNNEFVYKIDLNSTFLTKVNKIKKLYSKSSICLD